ncbi:ROR1 [Branchiostoma lanceolatum]|uniref:Tyrosine-protein kinase receptor n=1 Tax=Branchiostoma lanceolatum TaxID=7740 RepID=A0A8K0E8W2_BRALA|nr:ROR1 [Branchiostoma lanceolatum]CAH1244275.1 ROR1 [Branchiostoma lanceolatum]
MAGSFGTPSAFLVAVLAAVWASGTAQGSQGSASTATPTDLLAVPSGLPRAATDPPTSRIGEQLYLQLVEPMHNVTIGMGDRAVLRCKVEGIPPPNFRWYKNDAPLTSERRRIQIRNYSWGSRLRIKKVDTHDTGYYRCVATNGQDRVSTQAILYVRYMAANPSGTLRLVQPMNNETVQVGNRASLNCKVEGLPSPVFRWYRNDAPLSAEKNLRLDIRNYEWGSRLRIRHVETQDTGYYRCVASNQHQSIATTGILYVKYMDDSHTPATSDGDMGGYCQQYRGAGLPQFHRNATIYMDTLRAQGIIENQLTAAFTVIGTSSDLTKRCADYAIPSLCHYAFKYCDEHYPYPQPRQLCRDECEILENDICKTEYILAKTHHLIGEWILPDCSELPLIGTPASSNCIRIGIPTMNHINRSHSCYEGKGSGYRGTVAVTKSGIPCQAWNREAPHVHFLRASQFPELAGGHNYCRNPGNEMDAPFCFTTDESTRAEECDIPKCVRYLPGRLNRLNNVTVPEGGSATFVCTVRTVRGVPTPAFSWYKNDAPVFESSLDPRVELTSNRWESRLVIRQVVTEDTGYYRCVANNGVEAVGTTGVLFVKYGYYADGEMPEGGTDQIMSLIIILVPSISVPLIIALVFFIYCTCRRHGDARGNGTRVMKGQASETIPLQNLFAKHVPRCPQFPIGAVRFLTELGEGAFGKVYKGELVVTGSGEDAKKILVAIKTLKENATLKTQHDFHREVDMLADLRHQNIVCLLGVVMRDQPMCMLFEYMRYGDLHEFLVMRSPHSDVGGSSDDAGSHSSLDHTDFLCITTQIAGGMDYLASKHFCHRDLAARNCLVGDNLLIKISDFGLSRDIYSSDYYRVQSKSLLPVRWMPPEAIMYGKFSTDSDVWSFGVVLWEIFSYGLQPYYGYSNQEVIEMIRGRQLLPCPDNCPARMYSLMLECWNEIPARRPSFNQIHTRLRAWEGMAHSGSHSSGSNQSNANVQGAPSSASQSPVHTPKHFPNPPFNPQSSFNPPYHRHTPPIPNGYPPHSTPANGMVHNGGVSNGSIPNGGYHGNGKVGNGIHKLPPGVLQSDA